MKRLILFVIMSTLISRQAGAQEERIPAKGFAVHSNTDHFHPFEFTRHAVGDNDIQIEILYAGICHSDLHAVWQDNGHASVFPMVPGHEIAGRVVKVGKNVTKFKVGDLAGVGCMVNACHHCESCEQDREQFCENGTVFTYGSVDKYHNDEITYGGYSDNLVVSDQFAIKIPDNADLEKVAPLLCAGITTYSPIRFSGVKAGDKVGVAGMGGLGHMAVQYLVKLGAEVTIFDITEQKRQDAARMGAARYVNVNHAEELNGLRNTMDFIITTIPYDYDPVMYVSMLKPGGELAVVGLPGNSNINITSLVWNANRKVYGSLIGGIKETQEMLDYSVANGIYPEIEIIKADASEIDRAYQRIADGDVKFRFVIDMKTIE